MKKCQQQNRKWQYATAAMCVLVSHEGSKHSTLSDGQTMVALVVLLQFLSSNYARVDLDLDSWSAN